LTSSAHTYRLLVFKEHVCEQIVLLSSAALSAAEKRDYEHCFAARQQFFHYIVATAGFFFLRWAGALCCSTRPTSLPLSRRVSVSAKEA
ncbi:hypothetical protein KTE62_10475, partial [Burkholderia multivorans]|uniref:hypothetical protein n=1 Tax=Burkholderia multivorans TaxID=87883 RepID=UPI001C21B963